MSKIFNIIIILIAIISCQNQSNTNSNSGEKLFRDINEYKEFSDYREGGAAAIDDLYGISSNQNIIIKNTKLIVFEKVHRFGDKVKYSIVDTLLIENIPANHYIGYGDCRLNGKVDREVIVLYESEDNVEYYTKIKKAWRADRKLKKIIEIDTKGIDYVNEGYGV